MKLFLLSFFLLAIIAFKSPATTFQSINDGCWEDDSIWQNGSSPSYNCSDTVIINHNIVLHNDLVLFSNAYLTTTDSSGICGHHNIYNTGNAHIVYYGNLNLDTLFVSDGIVDVYSDLSNTFNLSLIVVLSGQIFFHNTVAVTSNPFSCYCSLTNVPSFSNYSPIEIKIYPNPSNGNFTIGYNNLSEKSIQVFDVTAIIIYEKNKIKNSEEPLNLSAHPKGIYFLKIIDKDKTSVNKIVIH